MTSATLRRFLPRAALQLGAHLRHRPFQLPVGRVRWGDLARLEPISRDFGYDRGTPVDRFYIEAFLARHAREVRGDVLEVKDGTYTRRYGGAEVVNGCVVDIDRSNVHATLIADLAEVGSLPHESFDCVILTQVLQLIFDVDAAIANIHQSLRPGGVLLLTVPGITPIASATLGHTWYWSFSAASAERLLHRHFATDAVEVSAHGNVMAATAFLHGLALEEVREEDLEFTDDDYQVIVTACARKQR